MKGKKRPLSERTRAVGIALVDGVPAAAEMTGIPERTIRQWQESDEFADLRRRTREEVAEEWWAIVQMGFRRVAHLLTGTDDLQKAAVASAIIADKMLLIRGEATSRYESVSLTDGISADEKRELRERLARSVHSESVVAGEAGDPVGVGAGVDS